MEHMDTLGLDTLGPDRPERADTVAQGVAGQLVPQRVVRIFRKRPHLQATHSRKTDIRALVIPLFSTK